MIVWKTKAACIVHLTVNMLTKKTQKQTNTLIQLRGYGGTPNAHYTSTIKTKNYC